jgi:hypothetical protein
MRQEYKKIVSYYCLSSTIRVKDVTLGDQKEDGKSKDIFRIERNRPQQTQALRVDDDADDYKYEY